MQLLNSGRLWGKWFPILKMSLVPQLTSERFLNPPEYFVWISEDYLDTITKTRKVNVRTAVLTTDL